MADLEDGEILDSEEEDIEATSQEKLPASFQVLRGAETSKERDTPIGSFDNALAYRSVSRAIDDASRSSYRSSTPQDADSSSDSLESDEDSDLWKSKQAKYFRSKEKSMQVDSSQSDTTQMRSSGSGAPVARKKQNNVWGSVLTEQDLTHTLVEVGVEQERNRERDVESYDFTKKYQDPRPDLDESKIPMVESHDPFDRVIGFKPEQSVRSIIDYEEPDSSVPCPRKQGRKRKAENCVRERLGSRLQDRLGPKKMKSNCVVGGITVTKDNTDEEIVTGIVDCLNEPNKILIGAVDLTVFVVERVVQCLGGEVAVRLLHETRDLEDAGGMMVLDGSRRRTPGGVFLQLMKGAPEYNNKEHGKIIFQENFEMRQQQKKESRQRARRRKHHHKSANKMETENGDKHSSDDTDDLPHQHTHSGKGKGEATPTDFQSELEKTKQLILESKSNPQDMEDTEEKADNGNGVMCRNPENGEEMTVRDKLVNSGEPINDLDDEESHVIDVAIGE